MISFMIIFGILIAIYMVSRFIQKNGSGKRNHVMRISAAEAQKILGSTENIVLIDVRTPEEYRQKHIPKSMSFPLDRLKNEAKKQFPDSSVPIITYCQTGRRSAMAAAILSRLGYQNIYDLGGILNWPYETESGRGNGA